LLFNFYAIKLLGGLIGATQKYTNNRCAVPAKIGTKGEKQNINAFVAQFFYHHIYAMGGRGAVTTRAKNKTKFMSSIDNQINIFKRKKKTAMFQTVLG